MGFELPVDPRDERRARVSRWVATLLSLAMVGLLAYLAYVGYEGSRQMVEPEHSQNCRTPQVYGWAYEAINYDGSADAALAAEPNPLRCANQGPPAGDALLSSDGIHIAGWYVPAGRSLGPTGPTVVVVHGWSSNKSGVLPLAEVLHDDYNLVLFDLRNHGQSSSAVTTLGVLEQRDLEAVLDWLVATKAPERIAVMAESMGGAAAVNEVAKDPRVDALLLDSTHATLSDAIAHRLNRAGYPLSLPGSWAILLGGLFRTGVDMTSVDPIHAVDNLGGRPLLIMQGGADTSFDPASGQQLYDAAVAAGVNAELQVCPEASHSQLLMTCPDAYRGWVLGFLARALGT